MSESDREKMEANLTFRRIIELERLPVQGKFDAAHLREVNRRIFQDLPSVGFTDVKPGQYRPEVPPGRDWVKNRGASLSTVSGVFFVAYSPMDAAARKQLDRALTAADPDKLRTLKPKAFADALTDLYAQVDYIHPFSDGNSRTLRTFTRQLAREAGFDLDWQRIGETPNGRDALYVARDLTVNKIALPHLRDSNTRRDVLYTMDMLAGNRELQALVRDIVRPSRAAVFERLPETDALSLHPELAPAFKTLATARDYFASKMPANDPAAQRAALDVVKKRLQGLLNQGETKDFSAARGQQKPSPLRSREKPKAGPEKDR